MMIKDFDGLYINYDFYLQTILLLTFSVIKIFIVKDQILWNDPNNLIHFLINLSNRKIDQDFRTIL